MGVRKLTRPVFLPCMVCCGAVLCVYLAWCVAGPSCASTLVCCGAGLAVWRWAWHRIRMMWPLQSHCTNAAAHPCSCGSWRERKHDASIEDDPQPRLNFWAKMNRDAYEYGMTHLGPKRYFLLRTEDMALENTGRGPLLARLAAFLNLPKMRPEQLEDLVEVAQGHEDSYGGRKWNTTQRAHLIERFGDVGRSALGLFGYKLYDWGLAKPAPVVDGSRYMH